MQRWTILLLLCSASRHCEIGFYFVYFVITTCILTRHHLRCFLVSNVTALILIRVSLYVRRSLYR